MSGETARDSYGCYIACNVVSRNVRRRPFPKIFWAALGLFATSAALGQSGVIVHEYIPPDAAEDLALGAMTPSGKMPAVLRTPSGLVSAPDKLRRGGDAQTPTYTSRDANSTTRFRIDGATSDPGTLHYHEPFRPSIAPFKRMVVFDAVNEAFELYLRDPTRHAVELAGAPEASDDEFFADVTVTGTQLVRFPSVASGMRIVAAELDPPVHFQLLVDTAENWFFHAPSLIGNGRLILRIAAPRAALSPQVVASTYASLANALPNVPASVTHAVEPILAQVGVSRALPPTEAVRILVSYFRSFLPSSQHIDQTSGKELYEQLTLTRKGVCRHRAFAFVVTALVLGIPARFVHNEAHAWVEVFDGRIWHRVDLGGAASGLHFDGEKPEGPAYRMPKDNYDWPSQARPGDQLSARFPADQTESVASGSGANTPANSVVNPPRTPLQSTPHNVARLESTEPEPEPASLVPENRATPKLSLRLLGSSNVHRGEALTVEGSAQSDGNACRLTRIDVALRRGQEHHTIGSTATDEQGRFRLQATVPLMLGVGPYELVAASGDSASCRASAR